MPEEAPENSSETGGGEEVAAASEPNDASDAQAGEEIAEDLLEAELPDEAAIPDDATLAELAPPPEADDEVAFSIDPEQSNAAFGVLMELAIEVELSRDGDRLDVGFDSSTTSADEIEAALRAADVQVERL